MIWQQLESFGREVDETIKAHKSNYDAMPELIRLKTILEFTGKRLNLADPAITPTGPLDHIQQCFAAAHLAVEEFANSGDGEKLAAANQSLNDALEHVASIPIPLTSDDIGSLRGPADAYRQSMEETIESAGKLMADLSTQSTAIRTEQEASQANMLAVLNEHLAELNQGTFVLKDKLALTEGRVDSVISEFQLQFSAAQESRQNDFSAAKDLWRNEFAEWHQKNEAAFLAEREAARTKTQEVLDEMNTHKGNIETLVGVIGNLGMTSGYQKAAASAEFKSRVWQVVTISAIVLLIGVMVCLSFQEKELNTQSVVLRLILATAFGVLAAYAGTQADRYMESERSNRRVELELQAIGPYLAPLSDEDQNEFRLELARKFFGRRDGQSRMSKSPTNIFDVVATDEMRELIGKTVGELKTLNPDLLRALPEVIAAFRATKKE